MEILFETHLEKLKRLKYSNIRDFADEIDWNDRLIGIKGARGVGKTTLLLQKIKEKNLPPDKILYVSLDDLWFLQNSFIDLVRQFVQRGGTCIFADEVHKYPNWSQEFKNCYDTWSELQIIFTGSSVLHINDSRSDLSRRAMVYSMPGLSFREYLNFNFKTNFKAITLNELIENHSELTYNISSNVKPLSLFGEYLKIGYYPYCFENKKNYTSRLRETIMYVIDVDLVQLRNISVSHILLLKKLVNILCQSVPYKPNIVKLAELIGISRNTLISYLNYLEEAQILTQIYSQNTGNKLLQKPEKLYLNNPNLYYSLTTNQINLGALRETFFLNQVSKNNSVKYSDKGDFLVDDKYIFEIGGRTKTYKQIANIPNSFIASDDLEISVKNKIPLWLFGFLY